DLLDLPSFPTRRSSDLKRLSALLAVIGFASVVAAPAAQAGEARFDWFEYRGTDGEPVGPGEYRNPVLAGFYPDPSTVRVGDDFRSEEHTSELQSRENLV